MERVRGAAARCRKDAVLASSSPADGDAEAMVTALLAASRLLVAVSARSLASVDETLTLPQFRMLVVLHERGPLSLSMLAAELDVQPSTALRMIERLVVAGTVERGTAPTDRRASVISLTDKGRRTVAETTGRRRAELTRIVEAMPVTHRRGLIRALHAFSYAGSEPSALPAAELGW
jgi:DNA-binding MarR family transcriptional regulator